MRFRGKSIRRKIVALLLVPLVALTAIWAFATVLTGREATRLFTVSTLVEKVGYPVEDTVRLLQQERRQTLVYLADPRASNALPTLRRTRSVTDEAIAEVRRYAADSDVRDALSRAEAERLTAALDTFAGIGPLRKSVENGTVDRAQALGFYNHLIDPCHLLLANLNVIDDVTLDKQYRALVNLSRARELLSREDALLGSALVVGRLTADEVSDVSDLAAQRTLLYDVTLPLLPAADRERYERFWRDASSAPLRAAEDAVVASGTGPPTGIDARSWDAVAGEVLDALGTLDDEAADRYENRAEPVAMGVITKAVVAGTLGVIALLFSVFLSVRIGRSLIRDLKRLRLEAHEASHVRLPSVMRRLSAGEQVDVETEVPRREYDRNEIGEVGEALNTLQRAAVEAAVKQAELRAGVSEVFVNLARRSQVLLHKQLTLLDTMERRTEDTEELADLFRLDHLTTRMRRHAEGLVILSGAAPSRQWRKPVQLMDVVRAAVAEVEDYERIEVRRLPRIAVTGSAVADLTHLVAEFLENATVFSPPHTAVQVRGERVANGFTLEIHDRGLGMTADTLLDANLRLAETPEFELSDTDRLGLFVVARLAQRQNVRVSLQPSPYGGTTAVVFIPEALLTDDAPDTNGAGFRLDRPGRAAGRGDGERGAEERGGTERGGTGRGGAGRDEAGREEEDRRTALARLPGTREPGTPAPLPRRRTSGTPGSHGRPGPGRQDGAPAPQETHTGPGTTEQEPPSRSHGRAGEADGGLPARRGAAPAPARTHGIETAQETGDGSLPLPRRVRQASLAPQLKRERERPAEDRAADPADRDAEEVRSRMASLQRGWQRGRRENAADGTAPGPARGTAPTPPASPAPPAPPAPHETNKGDGR
ncbi:sensor histidine kinase [Streptomyces daghestanicus]|uniref:histidine kinase n=1 Tax=Streptomyces daghestanicus TaxID=66885 RepID=A0ABQ3PV25_9ACTN|nr:nitrate- and nitrite sensing domain-containing protein [Streptomyces daghestanicus]GGU69755.1 histidine kinase [Streptomyces daghestanicus]GHI28866.1 histidine kinase [Streptomyces daghestanicus]